MGITLDTNMYLLCSMFNISYKKITDEYSGMSVEDIMKAEAAQGNTAAASFDQSVLNDPNKLIELFELQNPGNKFAILSNMNERDLDELLPLLKPQDLTVALNYFTKDKLLNMFEELPKEELVNYVMQMFAPEQLMQYMPEEQLNKALQSTDMDKSLEIKYLKTMKPEILAQMYEAATGQEAPGSQNVGMDGKAKYDSKELYNSIVSLPDDKFQDAMLAIPTQNKKDFMSKMAKEDPKIFQMFDSDAYCNIINQRKEKADMVLYANVIDEKQLVNMVSQLPQDLTAAVLTQIDTDKFADVLLSKFKNILSQVIAG